MTEKKFSIIVPVYNVVIYKGQNLLELCIDSLVRQSFKNIEIILIDDGSRDDAPLICDEYAKKDPRIKVIHKANEGAGVARNVGIKNAEGEYILFVDSDDEIQLNSCEIFYDILTKHSDLDIISSNYQIVEGDQVYYRKFSSLPEDTPLSGSDFLKYQLPKSTFCAVTGYHIVRRRFLIEHDMYFNESIIGGEDLEWAPRIYLKADKVTVSNFTHYTHRRSLPLSRSNPKIPTKRSTGIIRFCEDLAVGFEKIEDNVLRSLMLNYLVLIMFYAIDSGKFYKKEFRGIVNKDFLNKNAYLKKTKVWVFFYNIHPCLYHIVFLLNNIRVKLIRRLSKSQMPQI